MDKFTKQPYEAFHISVDFSKNLTDSETISSQVVTAVDKDGAPAAAVLNQVKIGNDGEGIVFIQVQEGTEDASPYKITFRCVTSSDNKWEKDVTMEVEEI